MTDEPCAKEQLLPAAVTTEAQRTPEPTPADTGVSPTSGAPIASCLLCGHKRSLAVWYCGTRSGVCHKCRAVAERGPDLLDEIDTLCQAIEGHRGGALTNDGLWHYHEKARRLLKQVGCASVSTERSESSGITPERSEKEQLQPPAVTTEAQRNNDEELAFVRKLIAEKRQHLPSRMDGVNAMRDGDEASHRAAHKMAEQMAGRKIPYLNAAQREESAKRDERIGNIYCDEIALLENIERILVGSVSEVAGDSERVTGPAEKP